ncbi:hypothetical protein RF11_10476 [Thelohanellus kitauei]|uniref:Uncharacterized protein n=1 Tax=Thelohanellus kitauei TaxID=669202 RepID=A0A0C2MIP9_THEKT|nr:hypothetical protein RF11_10476 [Thelohanellus kitauei]
MLSFHSPEDSLDNSQSFESIPSQFQQCISPGNQDLDDQSYKISLSSLIDFKTDSTRAIGPVKSVESLKRSDISINSKLASDYEDDELKFLFGQHIYKLLKEINQLYLSMVSQTNKKNKERVPNSQDNAKTHEDPLTKQRMSTLQNKILSTLRKGRTYNIVNVDFPTKFDTSEGLYGVLRVTNIQTSSVKYIGFEIYVVCEVGVAYKVILTKVNPVSTPSNYFIR